MRDLVTPSFLADQVWTIDLDALAGMGIRGIILDLDNTIVNWGDTWVRPEVSAWLRGVQDRGLRVCVVSNALRPRRVRVVAQELGIPAVMRAGKPLPSAFRKGMEALGTDSGTTCAIGDQVFTDILGANWLGLTTILVTPLSPRESPHTRLIRFLERFLRRRWARRVGSITRDGGSARKSSLS